MPTDYEFALANLRNKADELSVWANSLGVSLRGLEDPQAARSVQMASGVSNAARNLSKAAQLFGDQITTSITNAVNNVVPPHSGVLVVAFGGAANEFHYVGPIPATWVTAGSDIRISYMGPVPNPPPTFACEQFRGSVSAIVAGVSFTVVVNNPGAPIAANYNFSWQSFG